jgi:hypothetical protein
VIASPATRRPYVLPLAALLALTRYHYFASLPDAALAVFLLAGFISVRPGGSLFIAEAAVVDYVAITSLVSATGVSRLRGTLGPAYSIPWLAGRFYQRMHRWEWRTLLPLAGAVLASVTAAFVVSDGSFYLLSGYFPELSWGGYVSHFAKYYPYYLVGTSVYVAVAALLHIGVRSVRPLGAGAQARARSR